MGKVEFSIIIPNMNGMEHLPDCCASLAAADYPPDQQEWIVSDNGSVDGSVAWLRDHYPRARIVANGRNIGFAPGCNAGAAVATGAWLVFLNNDTRVHRDWLHGYEQALACDPQAVCAGSYMRSWDDREVDFDGATANLFGAGWQRPVIGWPDRPVPLADGDPMLFACGGAMCIRRDVFAAVGGFDPRFFIYFEDVDLGWRLWVLGHRVVFARSSIVYHKEGGTTGATRAPSYRRYRLFERNILALIIKNYEAAHLDRVLPAALLLEWQRAILSAGDALDRAQYALRGPTADQPFGATGLTSLPPMSLTHLVAMHGLVELLPALLAERARIQAARRRPDREIFPLLGRPFRQQFDGPIYADRMRRIAAAFDLYGLIGDTVPSRILLLAPPEDRTGRAAALEQLLTGEFYLCHNPPLAAELAPSADLLLAVGPAIPAAAALATPAPLVADVTGLTPSSLPPAFGAAIRRRAGLLITAEAATAPAWAAAFGIPCLVQPPGAPLDPALRHYCRYPLHQVDLP
ncbi:MAG: glycosyltransferase family 2 protein [Chloroflexota bacterium]|nr:glycosyltransferase family 2 protein [Chloroflexota bacterium]